MCAASIQTFINSEKTITCRGRHGNFYFNWKSSNYLLTDKFFKIFVGDDAYKKIEKDEKTQKIIKKILSNMDTKERRAQLKGLDFKTQIGGVKLDSDSSIPNTPKKTKVKKNITKEQKFMDETSPDSDDSVCEAEEPLKKEEEQKTSDHNSIFINRSENDIYVSPSSDNGSEDKTSNIHKKDNADKKKNKNRKKKEVKENIFTKK